MSFCSAKHPFKGPLKGGLTLACLSSFIRNHMPVSTGTANPSGPDGGISMIIELYIWLNIFTRFTEVFVGMVVGMLGLFRT